jgi:hypothetical protein
MAEKVSVEIGNSQYNLSQETQNLLKHISTSSYPHSRSVLIIQEPHEFAAAQFSLYKGLERFFEDNTSLIGKTVFLAEGTPANQPISVQSLVAEESHPSDEIIKQTLATFLITGYMAYEWKYQHGTSIIGTEDRALYDMSRQFAAVCRRTPNAIFEKLQYKDGTEFPIPLGWAWVFAVTARNKSIAETLIEKTKEYENPILFVGGDHLKRMEDSIFALIKDEMIDAAFRGPE